MEQVKCCNECDHFRHEGSSWDDPYPSFWCGKGNFDAIGSFDDLYEETNCIDFKLIGVSGDAKV